MINNKNEIIKNKNNLLFQFRLYIKKINYLMIVFYVEIDYILIDDIIVVVEGS